MGEEATSSTSRGAAGREAAALIGATALTGCVLAGTVVSLTTPTQARSGPAALAQLVTLAGWLTLVVISWAQSRDRPTAAAGTSLLGLAWAAPSLAGSTSPPAMSRAALLAVEALGMTGLALIVQGWSVPSPRRWMLPLAALLGCEAAAAHLLGYNPFDDPACTLTCEPTSAPVADLLGPRAGLGVSAGLSLLAAGALLAALARVRGCPTAIRLTSRAAAVCLAVGAVLPWWRWGSTDPGTARERIAHLGVLTVTWAIVVALVRVRRARQEMTRVLNELTGTGSRSRRAPTHDLHFTAPERQDWVDRHGDPVPPSTGRHLVLQDESGPAIRMPLGDREDPDQVREALTAAARMALDNARLDALARARLKELRASQRRIVEAFDTERVRIERDLHDGAQQRLVAAALHLRAAARRVTPDGADEIATVAGQVRDTLEALRDLSHGPVPAVVAEEGLLVALRELAAASPLPVDLPEPVDLPPAPAEAAATAYLTAVAALDNAARYAHATRVTLTVTCDQDTLTLHVQDDGRGGAVLGPGLTEVADRAGALGGHLALASRQGEGTRVTVVLPCGS